jgi:hypothetical protein
MGHDGTVSEKSRGNQRHRGRFERFLFSFMGPPQLGDPNEPARPRAARPVELCPRCGRPFDEHEVVRSSIGTFSRCPD